MCIKYCHLVSVSPVSLNTQQPCQPCIAMGKITVYSLYSMPYTTHSLLNPFYTASSMVNMLDQMHCKRLQYQDTLRKDAKYFEIHSHLVSVGKSPNSAPCMLTNLNHKEIPGLSRTLNFNFHDFSCPANFRQEAQLSAE